MAASVPIFQTDKIYLLFIGFRLFDCIMSFVTGYNEHSKTAVRSHAWLKELPLEKAFRARLTIEELTNPDSPADRGQFSLGMKQMPLLREETWRSLPRLKKERVT